MGKYVIINEDNGMMLTEIGIKKEASYIAQEQRWTKKVSQALQFELEEAQATIQFINDVIDWELAQNLSCKLLEL